MKGAIRIVAGMALLAGAVGGMEHIPHHFTEQLIYAVVGLALLFWAARDINNAAAN